MVRGTTSIHARERQSADVNLSIHQFTAESERVGEKLTPHVRQSRGGALTTGNPASGVSEVVPPTTGCLLLLAKPPACSKPRRPVAAISMKNRLQMTQPHQALTRSLLECCAGLPT